MPFLLLYSCLNEGLVTRNSPSLSNNTTRCSNNHPTSSNKRLHSSNNRNPNLRSTKNCLQNVKTLRRQLALYKVYLIKCLISSKLGSAVNAPALVAAIAPSLLPNATQLTKSSFTVGKPLK